MCALSVVVRAARAGWGSAALAAAALVLYQSSSAFTAARISALVIVKGPAASAMNSCVTSARSWSLSTAICHLLRANQRHHDPATTHPIAAQQIAHLGRHGAAGGRRTARCRRARLKVLDTRFPHNRALDRACLDTAGTRATLFQQGQGIERRSFLHRQRDGLRIDSLSLARGDARAWPAQSLCVAGRRAPP